MNLLPHAFDPQFLIPSYIPIEWHDRIRVIEDEKGVHYIWTGWTNGKGHGKVSVKGKAKYTHRLVVERVNGIVLGRYDIVDHLCRHRGCMNYPHLEVVTMGVNTERGLGLLYQFKRKEEYERARAA